MNNILFLAFDLFPADFFWFIYIPIVIWLLLITTLMIFLVVKYTLGKWTAENPNPYEGETLGIPRGVLRGLLTLTLLFVVVIFEVHGVAKGITEEGYMEFVVAFKMMIAFYFGSKVAHHVTSTERKKAEIGGKSKVEKARAENPSNNEEEANENFEFMDEDEEDDGEEAFG